MVNQSLRFPGRGDGDLDPERLTPSRLASRVPTRPVQRQTQLSGSLPIWRR